MATQARHADAQASTVARPQPAQRGGPSKADSRANGPAIGAGAPITAPVIWSLQRTAGNTAVGQLIARSPSLDAKPPAAGERLAVTVQRWEGPEHVDLGDLAKGGPAGFIVLDAHARDLPGRTKPVASWPKEWQALHSKGSALQKRVLEKGVTYGEIVALSGDLYKDFDALNKAPLREIYDLVPLMRRLPGGDFADTKQLEAATGGRYLALAKENESHFSNAFPGRANIDVWSRQHAAAINAARNGNANLAWAMNAAADHFLTDAFSGGHIRVPRSVFLTQGTKGQLKSKIAHDLDNENGVEVNNARGDGPWIAYGDNMLEDKRNTRNKMLAVEAVELSKQDIADALAQRKSYPEPKVGTKFASQRLVPYPTNPSLNRWGKTDIAEEVGHLAKTELPGQISAIWQDDNRARAWIRRQSVAALGRQSVADRVRMINVLLDGPTLDDDENAILRVLRASVAAGDQVAVINAVGAHGMVDDFDGSEYTQIRALLRASYYGQTDQGTAFGLISACIDGWTHEWEESMIVDILELQPNGRALVEQVGQKYGGKAKGSDKNFRNGMSELEDQLDGSDETKLHQLFPRR